MGFAFSGPMGQSAPTVGSPGQLPAAPSRLVPLDALRALAVFLVMGRHIPVPASLPAGSVLRGIAEAWQRGGWIGVDLFFVLSGFLISGLLFREHRQHGEVRIGRFFLRRGLKIYPAFYVFLVVTVALRFVWGRHVSGSQILAEVFFVQNYVHGVWNHTWSLAVEEHFYILLPLLLLVLLKRARGRDDPFAALPVVCATLATVLLGARVANALTHGYQHQTHLFPTHLRIDSLMFGVLLSYWYHYRSLEFREAVHRRRVAFALLGVALLVPPFILPVETSMSIYTVGLSGLALGSGLLLSAALAAPAGVHAFLAPLARVGSYSYSIYLWHLPVLGWWMSWVEGLIGHRLPYLPRTLLGVTACVVFGIGISQLIEYRVLRFRDRRFPSRSQALAPVRGSSDATPRAAGAAEMLSTP